MVMDAGTGIAREADERVQCELAQREAGGIRILAGQRRMRGVQHQRQRVLQQSPAGELRRQHPAADDGHIQLIGEQRVDLAQAVHFAQLQLHLRMLFAVGEEGARNLWQQRDGAGQADAQLAAFAALRTLHHVHRNIHPLENVARLFEQHQAGGCELHTAVAAHEQVRADQRFQLPYLLAEWRLRHAQPLGGATEMQRVGHGEEITQMAEFQGHWGCPGGEIVSRDYPLAGRVSSGSFRRSWK